MKKRNDTIDGLRAIINAKEEAMKLQIIETDRLRLQNGRMRLVIQNLLKQLRALKPAEAKKVCEKCGGKGEYYKLIRNGKVLVTCDCKKQTDR